MSSPARPDDPSPRDAQTWAHLIVRSAIWGSSFPVIRMGLEEGIGQLATVSRRALNGGAFLAPRWPGAAGGCVARRRPAGGSRSRG